MRYCVQYEPEKSKKYPLVTVINRKSRVRFLSGFLAFVALCGCIRHKDAVISWLIPGDDQVTVRAAEELIGQLQEGAPLGEAVTTFCEDIIENE